MTRRFTTSRPDTWIAPRQTRWNDWHHGHIISMREEEAMLARSLGEKPQPSFIKGIGGILCGLGCIAAFGLILYGVL